MTFPAFTGLVQSPPAGPDMMTAGRLTPEQQAQAVAEWGRAGSFRCCVCSADVVQLGGTVHTRSGFGMAACVACDTRMAHSPKFRRKAERLADAAAQRSLLQRVADLVGVTGAALLTALPRRGRLPAAADLARADARLGVPAGPVEAAFRQVVGAGRLQ